MILFNFVTVQASKAPIAHELVKFYQNMSVTDNDKTIDPLRTFFRSGVSDVDPSALFSQLCNRFVDTYDMSVE